MAFYPASSSSPRQLSLDLDLDDAPSAHSADSGVKRSVIFPKNIQIFNVPEFQRQVSQLFDPLNINIEFRVTRQNRLEMRWSFPQEAIQYNHADARSDLTRIGGRVFRLKKMRLLKRWFYLLLVRAIRHICPVVDGYCAPLITNFIK